MENKALNDSLSGIKSNKDNINITVNEKQQLIPIKISLVKNIFKYPKQTDKNIIYLNDIETLNDSSLTNNIEQNSIKYNINESLNLTQTINNSKTNIEKNININQNNYLKNELIEKEKENHLLKKEIFKLKEDLNLSQRNALKLKKFEQNYEKNLSDIKKEFQAKEKVLSKIIEKLKNEIKTKDYILNSFQEKIILQNQTIERLKIQLKRKENQINELNRKRQKNLEIEEIYLKRDNSKIKEQANSSAKSTSKNKINTSNLKEKIRKDNKTTKNLLRLQNYHSNTHRENNISFYLLESSNTQKVISLKKKTKIKSPVLYKFNSRVLTKSNKDLSNNTQNIKIKTNLGKRFKHHSYSDRIKEKSAISSEKSKLNENLKDSKHIFLFQGKNSDDAFLKRYNNSNKNKNLKQNNKNSIGDNNYSYINPDSEYNQNNYKIKIPILNRRKNNSFHNKSNSLKSLEQKSNIIKRKFNDEIAENLKKINDKFIFSKNFQKNNSFIKKYFTDNKLNFLFTYSNNESNSVLDNKHSNITVNKNKLFDINSAKSNIISNNIFNN